MFISEFLIDTNFGLALFTLHVFSTINYNDKINCFTISEGDRSHWFETIFQKLNCTNALMSIYLRHFCLFIGLALATKSKEKNPLFRLIRRPPPLSTSSVKLSNPILFIPHLQVLNELKSP